MNGNKNRFADLLIDWFSKAKRELPWRKTKDPYKIWLSEIILQQTRVEQGMPYYMRFTEAYPTVQDLAHSDESQVLKLWEGLGYYSRARNLLKTAQQVSEDHGGIFPDKYDGLIKLKGIGPYTAAAIASIAFGEAKPVVDGNVFRFISRFYGIEEDISKAKTRKVFEQVLDELIPKADPGNFNQAMMEYGATVCAPKARCEGCFLIQECYAYQNQSIDRLPVKKGKVKTAELNLDYLIIYHDQKFLMQQRAQGIWNGLYQFFLNDEDVKDATLRRYLSEENRRSEKIKHLLTHKKLWVRFIHVAVDKAEDLNKIGKALHMEVYSYEEMLNLPRPKVIVNYLKHAVF